MNGVKIYSFYFSTNPFFANFKFKKSIKFELFRRNVGDRRMCHPYPLNNYIQSSYPSYAAGSFFDISLLLP